MRTSEDCTNAFTGWGVLADDEHEAAHSSVPVLISAPAALQVESVARRIHWTTRPRHPFAVINARELPSGQAALRAMDRRWLDSVTGGTVLIADVDTMPARVQGGFLAVLERMRASPPSDGVRVIAGTTADLFELMVEGHFSDVLFYRLNVIHLAYRLDTGAEAHHA